MKLAATKFHHRTCANLSGGEPSSMRVASNTFKNKQYGLLKVSVLLIIFLGIFSKTYSQDTKLTIRLNNVSLGQVFDIIQEQSEFIIFYKDALVDLNKKVTVNAENSTVNNILDQVFKNTNLKYKVIDRQIVIVPREEIEDSNIILDEIQLNKNKKLILGKVTKYWMHQSFLVVRM